METFFFDHVETEWSTQPFDINKNVNAHIFQPETPTFHPKMSSSPKALFSIAASGNFWIYEGLEAINARTWETDKEERKTDRQTENSCNKNQSF